ncbi:MAG: hypothetical protein H7Y30_17680 [Pyrinomonadaceae bacterium]|nr:hypothetical protein [Pyrinomonadaceae bacterium]
MKLNPLRPLSCLLLLSSLTIITGFFNGWNALPAFGQSSRHLTDELVVQAIGSPNAAEADRALVEALRRGDRMFTLLMANKGDSRPFAGRSFERTYDNWDCSALVSKTGGITHRATAPKVPVTVEVATLYLISAIYYDQRLDFAPYPHLMSKADTEAWKELSRNSDNAPAACAYHVMLTTEEFEAQKGVVKVSHRMPEVNTRSWSERRGGL